MSKLLTSRDVRELQFWNILSILVRELEKVGFIISLTEVMPKKPLSELSLTLSPVITSHTMQLGKIAPSDLLERIFVSDGTLPYTAIVKLLLIVLTML